MANYQLSAAMAEDKLFAFLKSTEGTGWDAVNAYPVGNDQWRVLTGDTTSTVIHQYTYRLLPAAEEGRLPEVLTQLQQAGWTLFSLQPVPNAPGLWRVMGRREGGSPGPKDAGPGVSS